MLDKGLVEPASAWNGWVLFRILQKSVVERSNLELSSL